MSEKRVADLVVDAGFLSVYVNVLTCEPFYIPDIPGFQPVPTTLLPTTPNELVRLVGIECAGVFTPGKKGGLSDTVSVRDASVLNIVDYDGRPVGCLVFFNEGSPSSGQMVPVDQIRHVCYEEWYKKTVADISRDHQYITNISHEIRTPLNGVLGYTQLLLKSSMTASQAEHLHRVYSCTVELMSIINDVLDYSRLRRGQSVIERECVSVRQLLMDLCDTMTPQTTRKMQGVTIDIKSSVPDYIVIDKQKLHQIILNLLSNASKYGRVRGRINIEIGLLDDGNIKCTVMDEGCGIDHSELPFVFNEFHQLSMRKTSNGVNMGHGLGLAIVQELVSVMGGTVSVQSMLGVGSAFTVTLPFQVDKSYTEDIAVDTKCLAGKVVFIVDDNYDNRIIISDIIHGWGMVPLTCASAREALHMCERDAPSFACALIDIHMPITSGVELAKQIRCRNWSFPMIALSSLDNITKAGSSDFVDVILKPVNENRLLSVVLKVIRTTSRPSSFGSSTSPRRPSTTAETIATDSVYTQRILIAEDTSYIRHLFVAGLANYGFQRVRTCVDGVECIEILDKGPKTVDTLLLDLRMPNKGGLDVIRHIRRKKYDGIRIVVITASISRSDRAECEAMGIKSFVHKPFRMETLVRILS